MVDFCLLLYFFAGITDVDWASPLSANLAFAVLLAAMVTTLCYGFLAFAGYRLRGYKDHSGAIAFGDLDGLTRAACAAAAVGMAVIAALMFIRMRTEVLYALGPQGWVTALVIALVLAVVSLLANFLVVAIHALDGSDEVARLEVLSAATSGPLSRAHRMQEKAALIPHRIAVRQRRATRAAVRAVTGSRPPPDRRRGGHRGRAGHPPGHRPAQQPGVRPQRPRPGGRLPRPRDRSRSRLPAASRDAGAHQGGPAGGHHPRPARITTAPLAGAWPRDGQTVPGPAVS